jgi:acyl-CoA synthetase (AMP-forming)/AMP-acid ligase II
MLASTLATWIELLQERARSQPNKTAFIFLGNGESETDSLTYGQLERRSQAIAAYLQSFLARGDRALLLYPPGLDFIAAFFGCLAAGVVAVPADLPRPKRPLSRVRAIVADAQAKAVLTTTAILTQLQGQLACAPDLVSQHWLAADGRFSIPVTVSRKQPYSLPGGQKRQFRPSKLSLALRWRKIGRLLSRQTRAIEQGIWVCQFPSSVVVRLIEQKSHYLEKKAKKPRFSGSSRQ